VNQGICYRQTGLTFDGFGAGINQSIGIAAQWTLAMKRPTEALPIDRGEQLSKSVT
jgi:hypothetical protein